LGFKEGVIFWVAMTSPNPTPTHHKTDECLLFQGRRRSVEILPIDLSREPQVAAWNSYLHMVAMNRR
jgi:hypothetical protein